MQPRAVFVLCMLLGSADLIFINLWLAPKAWPPSKPARTQPSLPVTLNFSAGNQQIAHNPPANIQNVNHPEKLPPSKSSMPKQIQSTANQERNNSVKPIVRFDTNQWQVRFDTNQWQNLSPEAKSQLKNVLAQLQNDPNIKIILEGHADARGKLLYNYRLSKLRAQTVLQFLSRQGIPQQRIRIRALGPSKPKDSNNTPTAWATNRRVVIRVER